MCSEGPNRLWCAAAIFFALVLQGGCGPSNEATKKPDFNPLDAIGSEDPNVDTGKAKAHIEKAVAALRDKQLDQARKHLRDAEPFADELKREEIRKVRQDIDSAEADNYVPDIVKTAEGGKCEDAITAAIKVIDDRQGTAIPTFVKKRTSKKILACLLGQLKADLGVGRGLAESETVKKALTAKSHQKLLTQVTDATVKQLIGQFDELIGGRKWAEAKTKLDELVQRKEAGKREYNRIMGVIRKGIGEDIVKKSEGALSDKGSASSSLSEVDKLIELAEWGKEMGSSVGGEPMPAAVKKARTALALWAVCAKFNCTLVAPKQSWTYGHVELKPALDPSGKTLEKIKHATKLWRIADSSSWLLVSKKDPGSLAGVKPRVAAAAGWIKAGGLTATDSSEWLPPGNAIIGTRVWGPLRKGQKTFELGKVISAKGANVAVERMADRTIVKLARGKVRFGTIRNGTKVLTLCGNSLKPEQAVIESVSFPKKGDPIAKVKCVASSQVKREQLGALRTQASWLPPRK